TLYLSMFIHYFSILHIYTFSLHDALPISFFFKIFSVITCSNCVISLAISTASVRFPSCWIGKVSLIVVIASPLWLKYVCLTFLRSEEHTSELQSRFDLVCRLLLQNKNNY